MNAMMKRNKTKEREVGTNRNAAMPPRKKLGTRRSKAASLRASETLLWHDFSMRLWVWDTVDGVVVPVGATRVLVEAALGQLWAAIGCECKPFCTQGGHCQMPQGKGKFRQTWTDTS
jgi:hypothetical protein